MQFSYCNFIVKRKIKKKIMVIFIFIKKRPVFEFDPSYKYKYKITCFFSTPVCNFFFFLGGLISSKPNNKKSTNFLGFKEKQKYIFIYFYYNPNQKSPVRKCYFMDLIKKIKTKEIKGFFLN